MKILSVIIPCYNAQDYMEHAIETLLTGGERLEILLVDDGSKDNTAQIADDYEQRYPEIVRALHQENGGHGKAVTTGLHAATGFFVKVVDSDDWVDENALREILDFLENESLKKDAVDMLISNFIYDKQGVKHKKAMEYSSFLPTDRVFSWDEVHFPLGKYLLMHSVIYRRDVVVGQAQLELPHHTFYVDNLYVFEPLRYVKNIYYLDVNFYHYFIGRNDQSVNEQVMIGRIDQQLKVNRLMINFYAKNEAQLDPALANYMFRYLEIITTVSSILLLKDGSKESLRKKTALWNYIKRKDAHLYRELRWGLFGTGVNLPWKLGRKTALGVYKLARKMYGFN